MNHWITTEPPKDGSVIVAVGRVIVTDEISTSVESFVAAVRWEKDQSGYEGWHYNRDGMTVARALDDEVKIDWWSNFPKEDDAPPVPENPEELKLAKAAISHVLNALADDPRKYWLMGNGTESYAKLTTAAAVLWKTPVEKIRKDFQPEKAKHERYCEEVEANERLLRYCRDRNITVPV